jgi:hypothetical protein
MKQLMLAHSFGLSKLKIRRSQSGKVDSNLGLHIIPVIHVECHLSVHKHRKPSGFVVSTRQSIYGERRQIVIMDLPFQHI